MSGVLYALLLTAALEKSEVLSGSLQLELKNKHHKFKKLK
jgi:hypothetical protein